LRPLTSIYIKPVYNKEKTLVVGWTWDRLHNNKLVDYGRVPQPTISAAQEEALASTTTMTYPGAFVEWDRFWNDTEEERLDGKGFSESAVAPWRNAR
jgi:hypothetical protein